MFCRFCGKEIADESFFCEFCGKELKNAPSEPEATAETKAEPTEPKVVPSENAAENALLYESETQSVGWTVAEMFLGLASILLEFVVSIVCFIFFNPITLSAAFLLWVTITFKLLEVIACPFFRLRTNVKIYEDHIEGEAGNSRLPIIIPFTVARDEIRCVKSFRRVLYLYRKTGKTLCVSIKNRKSAAKIKELLTSKTEN